MTGHPGPQMAYTALHKDMPRDAWLLPIPRW